MDARTDLPTTLPAGTTLVVRRTHTDYPASAGWDLSVTLNGVDKLTVEATADGDVHVLTFTAAETGALAAGNYGWVERVSKAGAVYQIGSGRIVVTPDLETAAAGAGQTHAERTLAVLEAAVEGRLTKDLESYSIASRSVSKIPALELVRLKGIYEQRVAAERRGGQLGVKRSVRFGPIT